ncbi:unnamed protein product [Absidia cylindrospora]
MLFHVSVVLLVAFLTLSTPGYLLVMATTCPVAFMVTTCHRACPLLIMLGWLANVMTIPPFHEDTTAIRWWLGGLCLVFSVVLGLNDQFNMVIPWRYWWYGSEWPNRKVGYHLPNNSKYLEPMDIDPMPCGTTEIDLVNLFNGMSIG